MYVHKPTSQIGGGGGHPSNVDFCLQIFQNIDGFRQNKFTRLLEFIKLYQQNPLEIFESFFTIIPLFNNYTLALKFSPKKRNMKIGLLEGIECIAHCGLTHSCRVKFFTSLINTDD